MKKKFFFRAVHKFIVLACLSTIILTSIEVLANPKIETTLTVSEKINLKNNQKQENLQDNGARERGIKYYNLAIEFEGKGNKIEAIKNLNKAIEQFAKISDNKNYLVANLYLAQIYLEVGRVSKIEPILTEVISLARKENIPEKIAIARGLLGNLNLRFNRPELAIEQYNLSLKSQIIPATLISLSQAYYKKADQDKKKLLATENSLEIARVEQSIARDLNSGYSIAIEGIELSKSQEERIISRLSILKFYKNSLTKDQYTGYKSETIALIKSLPATSFKVSSLIEIASLSDSNEALNFLSVARQIADRHGDRHNASLVRENLGKTYLALNNLDRALENTEQALLIAQNSHNTWRMFYQARQLAAIQLALGNKDRAIDAYSLALSNLRSPSGEFGFHDLLFELRVEAQLFLREYINLLLESGESNRAIAVLSTLKLSELQAYFEDPCFDVLTAQDSSQDLSKIGIDKKKTATIYSFVGKSKLKLILKLPDNSLKSFQVNITAEELKQQIIELYDALGLQGFKYRSPLQKLNSLIIEPLERELSQAQIENLVFVQDGILRNIPMEVLLSKDSDRYLIEKYQILYLSGLQGSLPKKPISKGNNIFFGVSEARLGFNSLPFVLEEAVKARQFIGAQIYLNNDFTGEQFLNRLKGNTYPIIHLATHGSFEGTAENSWLLSFDALLGLEEVKQALLSTKFPPQLLIFSACETATGNSLATLGFAGIGLRARANNVIGSLWQVPDNSTALFMGEFYRELNRGANLAEAKRTAQIRILKESKNPLDWGGLILIVNSN